MLTLCGCDLSVSGVFHHNVFADLLSAALIEAVMCLHVLRHITSHWGETPLALSAIFSSLTPEKQYKRKRS